MSGAGGIATYPPTWRHVWLYAAVDAVELKLAMSAFHFGWGYLGVFLGLQARV